VASPEKTPAPPWTYRTEVSASGQPTPQPTADPAALLSALISLQGQQVEVLRQVLDVQRQQLELLRENVQYQRDQRARQAAEIERWQQGHGDVLDACKQSLSQLEGVHASLVREMTAHVDDHHENLLDGDFALSDFVDRFGPRLAHLNTILAILRPLAAGARKPETPSGGA
jgi:small-conductance mechanosensitive channel